MKKLINYLRTIWEGKDNKPSIRRLFAIVFLAGIIRMIERSYSIDCDINTEALMWLCVTLLALLGLTTVQNISEYKKVPTEGVVENNDNIK